MLMHAHACYSFDIVQLGTEAGHSVPQQNTRFITYYPLSENDPDVYDDNRRPFRHIKGGAKEEAANLRPALGPGGGSPSRTDYQYRLQR